MTEIAHNPTAAPTAAPEELLKIVGNEEGFAALHGAPTDIVSLALAGMPRGTRLTALAYELIEKDKQGRLSLTGLGEEVVAAAAVRHPEPFKDVTLTDLIKSMEAAVEQLNAGEDVRLAEAQQVRQSLPEASSETAAVQLSRLLVQLVRRGHARLRDREEQPTTTVHS
jgi:hypothetical protein